MRTVPEWIGKSEDEAIPTRVRLRVWERCGGRCAITGRKLRLGQDYEFDHILALCNGGENRERNLAPVLGGKPHREKTAADVAEKARTDRLRAAHFGIKDRRSSLSHPTLRKRMDGKVVPR